MDNQEQKIDPNAMLNVFIMSTDSIVYKGQAKSISSRNEAGRFDILPYHTNFICIIKEFVSILKENGEKQQIDIKLGILRVYENNVQIFMGLEGQQDSVQYTGM